jgi:hypothetical protein
VKATVAGLVILRTGISVLAEVIIDFEWFVILYASSFKNNKI